MYHNTLFLKEKQSCHLNKTVLLGNKITTFQQNKNKRTIIFCGGRRVYPKKEKN